MITYIKNEIKRLYETNPNIHVNIKNSRSKAVNETIPAVIKNVYSRFFYIEEQGSGYSKCHTVQYADVLTGHVYISELGQFGKG